MCPLGESSVQGRRHLRQLLLALVKELLVAAPGRQRELAQSLGEVDLGTHRTRKQLAQRRRLSLRLLRARVLHRGHVHPLDMPLESALPFGRSVKLILTWDQGAQVWPGCLEGTQCILHCRAGRSCIEIRKLGTQARIELFQLGNFGTVALSSEVLCELGHRHALPQLFDLGFALRLIEGSCSCDDQETVSVVVLEVFLRLGRQLVKPHGHRGGPAGISTMEVLLRQDGEGIALRVGFAEQDIEGKQDSRFARAVRADQAGVVVKLNSRVSNGSQIANLNFANSHDLSLSCKADYGHQVAFCQQAMAARYKSAGTLEG
ncbi:hypothetical protein L543_1590 [Bordetella hinzii L60]|nr:hypothetical protein L543_1590 [Bordetella hinzii L60]